MDQDFEGYAIDYSQDFEDEVFTRPDGHGSMAEGGGPQGRALRPAAGPDGAARFQDASGMARRLRAGGVGVQHLLAAASITVGKADMRRLQGALDWLAVADTDPGAAALAGLSRQTFLAVVGLGIMTIDELAGRAAALPRTGGFAAGQLAEIREVLLEARPGATPFQ